MDDGREWSHRRGRAYTKEEARGLVARQVNGVPGSDFRRLVTRVVSPWASADPSSSESSLWQETRITNLTSVIMTKYLIPLPF